MARAPNPGAPQRVSAHVVPKAAALPAEDDDKTAIEAGGWEEEASTTVEQSEVADKVRALGALGTEARSAGSNTNITSTTGSGVSDEPTVDDQRVNAALAMLPPPSVARLVVTRGNDSGRSLEVRPGKTYTVGRGVENDLVLTDITASRKHFDIRNENGSWILADRGSGNGTLINSRIEDAPFLLASGDTVEVGNTAFRFDFVSATLPLPGLPRMGPAQPRRDGPPSALNGRDAPARALPRLNPEDPDSVDLATPAVGSGRPVVREPPSPAAPREAAASGVRDPAEPHDLGSGIPHEVPNIPTFDGSVDDALELSTVSGKPLLGDELPKPAVTASRPKTLPPPTLPRPRTQTGRPPGGPGGYALDRAGPRSQQMAGVPQQLPLPPSALAAAMAPTISPAISPTISPMPVPVPQPQAPLPQMANRPAPSPALLDPSLGPTPTTLPGQGPPVLARGPRLPFSYPSAAEIASQYAISAHAPGHPRGPVQHGPRDATSTALVQPISYSNGQPASAPRAQQPQPGRSRRSTIALGLLVLAVFAVIATLAVLRVASGPSDVDRPVRAIPSRPPAALAHDAVAAPKTRRSPTVTPIQPVAAAPTALSGGGSSTSPPRIDTPTPPAANPTAVGPAPSARTTRTDKAPEAASTPPTTAKPPPATGPAAVSRTDQVASKTPPAAPTRDDTRGDRTDKRSPKRGDPRKPDRTDKRPVEVAAAAPRNDKKRGGRAMQDLKAEANTLYKSKNFSGAASLLTSSLSGFGSDDAKELKSIAAIYTQLGRAYSVGAAPGTKPTEAYQALRRAIDYDRDVGSAYIPEMQDKLVGIATRAASSYMASHEYELAFQAVRMAESLGSKSSSNQTVRTLLEETANDLYHTAQSELSADPEGAKQKLRQLLGMIDTRNPLYAKAQKLLNAP